MIKWVLGVVAVLFVAGGVVSAFEPEPDPQDRKYSSVEDLKAAVVKAGYKCPSWSKAEENSDLSGAIWTMECSNKDSLTLYKGAYARKNEESFKTCSDIVELSGRNWKFTTEQAAKYREDVGGYLCSG